MKTEEEYNTTHFKLKGVVKYELEGIVKMSIKLKGVVKYELVEC